jgi:glycosyltransferase involved in cell wall biosynthesis
VEKAADIHVVLDASLLGIGYYHPQAKTGVSRVAEQLIRGVRESPEVELSLASPTHLSETMRYSRETFGASAPPFVNSRTEQTCAGLENVLLAPAPVQSLYTKVLRQVFFRGRQVLNADRTRFRADRLPAQAVYHSPFYAIPEDILRMDKVHKVLTVHDLIPIFHPEWFRSGENSVATALATLPPDAWVTTVSESTKNDFCNYTGFDPERVIPIHLAASRELFYPVKDQLLIGEVRHRYGLDSTPYLLSLATLEPRKNIDHLIRCFVRLVESGELPADIQLVLVGTSGWLTHKIVGEVAKNPAAVQSRLVFTGFVPDADLAPLYAGALAFVYPSLFEGFGLPPLEAMQCGLPVICSDTSSLPEVVGDAAIQVPPTDADALCHAIVTLVGSAGRRQELSARALKRAELFSWERFISQHTAMYRFVASQGSSRHSRVL